MQPRLAQVEVTPKGVAIVKMDVLGEKQNTFNQEFYQDMEAMVDRVEKDEGIKSVVLSSGKPGSWIAGANSMRARVKSRNASACRRCTPLTAHPTSLAPLQSSRLRRSSRLTRHPRWWAWGRW